MKLPCTTTDMLTVALGSVAPSIMNGDVTSCPCAGAVMLRGTETTTVLLPSGGGVEGVLTSNSVGSVPRVKTSVRGFGHRLVASRPEVPQTVAFTTPSGRCQPSGGVSCSAAFMYAPQIRAGTVPPTTRFIGVLSSLPSQTPVTRYGVNPINQAFLSSSVVPVFPATGRPMWASVPVPRSLRP